MLLRTKFSTSRLWRYGARKNFLKPWTSIAPAISRTPTPIWGWRQRSAMICAKPCPPPGKNAKASFRIVNMDQINIIEIKARCADSQRIRAVLRERRAEFRGADHQVDT